MLETFVRSGIYRWVFPYDRSGSTVECDERFKEDFKISNRKGDLQYQHYSYKITRTREPNDAGINFGVALVFGKRKVFGGEDVERRRLLELRESERSYLGELGADSSNSSFHAGTYKVK